jgi:hypothetical protein
MPLTCEALRPREARRADEAGVSARAGDGAERSVSARAWEHTLGVAHPAPIVPAEPLRWAAAGRSKLRNDVPIGSQTVATTENYISRISHL